MLVVTNVRTSATLQLDIPIETLLPQDSGAREAAQVAFDLYDQALAFDLLPEDELVVSTVEDPAIPLVTCNVRVLGTDVLAIGRVWHVTAYDASTLLDRVNVVQDDRPAGESDHTRLVYLMTTYGAAVGLDPDGAGIATLNASMPEQKFRLLSLRQAIEQVLGTALVTGTYRLNAYKKLDTWDTASGLAAAPYDVVVGTPGMGEMAPENLQIKADTSNLYNAYWVRGATAAGSGWFTNPASITQWGRREKYIDAPDSDLSWKAFNVGMAALADSAQPLYRGTFTAESPFDGWRSNQRFALTSPAHDLVAAPFDTVRVTPRFLSGTGLQAYDIEFGSPKNSFTAKHGKEARRAGGVGPGSGGWGPGGGWGGGGVGGPGGGGGPVDCGCPPFFDTVCLPQALDLRGAAASEPWTVGQAVLLPTNDTIVTASDVLVTNEVGLNSIGTGTGKITRPQAIIKLPNLFKPPLDFRFQVQVHRTTSINSTLTYARMYLRDPGGAEILHWEIYNAAGTPGVTAPGDRVYVRGPYPYDYEFEVPTIGAAHTDIWLDGHVHLEVGKFDANVWVTGFSEPAGYGDTNPTHGLGNFSAVGPGCYLVLECQGGSWVAMPSTYYVGNKAMWQAITFDGCQPPISGQPVVKRIIGTGDGSTTIFYVPLGKYEPGSLEVEVDGIPVIVAETDPTIGKYTISFAPGAGDEITGKYNVG